MLQLRVSCIAVGNTANMSPRTCRSLVALRAAGPGSRFLPPPFPLLRLAKLPGLWGGDDASLFFSLPPCFHQCNYRQHEISHSDICVQGIKQSIHGLNCPLWLQLTCQGFFHPDECLSVGSQKLSLRYLLKPRSQLLSLTTQIDALSTS